MLCLQKGIQIIEISKGSEILLYTHHSYWGQKPESLDQTALSWKNGQTSKTKAALLGPSHVASVIHLMCIKINSASGRVWLVAMLFKKNTFFKNIFFDCATWHAGSEFLDQEMNPLQWKCRVLITGLSGTSQKNTLRMSAIKKGTRFHMEPFLDFCPKGHNMFSPPYLSGLPCGRNSTQHERAPR